jgi:hypothetical protein
MDQLTWRKALATAMRGAEDSGPVVAYAPDETTFDVEFDASWGSTNGPPVLAWTEQNVYFPVAYDGSEWMGSAPRNPQSEGQYHVGE